MLPAMSTMRHVRTMEEIARDLDLAVYRLERPAPEDDEARDAERTRLRRELEQIRDRLNERLRRQGPGVLHGELGAVDPDTAHRLNPADGQRIVRALEIFQHTGKPLSDWQSGQTDSAPEGLRFLKIVTAPPREELYSVIDDRFDWMIGAGAVEEVEALLDAGPAEDFPPLKAVGVPPIRAYIRGEIGRERMSELGKRDTRRYAKRQGTWFRHQIIPEITVQTKYSKKTNDQIFPEISDFLLTP